jgi:hypothetical protein
MFRFSTLGTLEAWPKDQTHGRNANLTTHWAVHTSYIWPMMLVTGHMSRVLKTLPRSHAVGCRIVKLMNFQYHEGCTNQGNAGKIDNQTPIDEIRESLTYLQSLVNCGASKLVMPVHRTSTHTRNFETALRRSLEHTLLVVLSRSTLQVLHAILSVGRNWFLEPIGVVEVQVV